LIHLFGAWPISQNALLNKRVLATTSYHFVVAVWSTKAAEFCHMKYWEIIADNLSKAGWSLGWVSAVDSKGRTIWIVDAHL